MFDLTWDICYIPCKSAHWLSYQYHMLKKIRTYQNGPCECWHSAAVRICVKSAALRKIGMKLDQLETDHSFWVSEIQVTVKTMKFRKQYFFSKQMVLNGFQSAKVIRNLWFTKKHVSSKRWCRRREKPNRAICDRSDTKKFAILAGKSLIENRSQECVGKGGVSKKTWWLWWT